MKFIDTVKNILKRVAAWFGSGGADKALNTAADYTVKALPIIDLVATIGTSLTPTTLDDKLVQMVKSNYPRLFDGSILTGAELKLYLLGAATDLMKEKYPTLSTSVARTAVQLAYTASTAKVQ
jgi:hypothetical protein